MTEHYLKREQFFNKNRDEVFEFFKDPTNLALITPSSLNFTILTPKPILMAKGTVIDYTIRVMGIKLHWKTEIVEYNPPQSFVDLQVKGPYSLWHHTHTFIEKDGGTLMTDEVRYAIPLGPIGSFAHALFVKKQLKEIFDFREQVIRKHLQ